MAFSVYSIIFGFVCVPSSPNSSFKGLPSDQTFSEKEEEEKEEGEEGEEEEGEEEEGEEEEGTRRPS